MNKERKQLALVAVLLVTLYAVWPTRNQKTNESATGTRDANPVSLSGADQSTIEPMADGNLEQPNSIPVRKRTVDIAKQRQRWTIEEILKRDPYPRSASASRPGDLPSTAVQAVYYSTSQSGQSTASVVVGGRVISKGHAILESPAVSSAVSSARVP